MSSSWGRNLRISIFGESHGKSIGVVLDGFPPGIALDEEKISRFMARRAPGQGKHTTSRKETDKPLIQSGFHEGHTTGTPLCALMENADTRSGDYGNIARLARPGHADYTGYVRYGGFNDVRGGGHFSGRLTAPLVFAGAVALQALESIGITIGAHIASIHGILDTSPNPAGIPATLLQEVSGRPFPVFDAVIGEKMMEEIEAARMNMDSVGGVVECYAVGLPAGIGSPMFGGVENIISSLLFGIPAVKGVEFGAGFAVAEMLGSENNDVFFMEEGQIACKTNYHGGSLGGITSGMPLVVRAAFKPTPSIAREQHTVDYLKKEEGVLGVKGRHDPCIVPRAVPCVEAAVAIALLDLLMEGGNKNGFSALAR